MTATLSNRSGQTVDFDAADFAQRGHQETITELGITDQRFIVALQAVAEHGAAAFIANSTDSLTIGTGTTNLTVEKNKTFFPDLSARIQEDGTPANYMKGTVNSYDPDTGDLEVDVTETGGSGTISDWKVLCAGLQGAKGDTTHWTPSDLGTVSGTVNLDLSSANLFFAEPTGSTTLNLQNVGTIAGGAMRGCKVILTGAGDHSLSVQVSGGSGTFSWIGGSAPTFATGTGRDSLVFDVVGDNEVAGKLIYGDF